MINGPTSEVCYLLHGHGTGCPRGCKTVWHGLTMHIGSPSPYNTLTNKQTTKNKQTNRQTRWVSSLEDGLANGMLQAMQQYRFVLDIVTAVEV